MIWTRIIYGSCIPEENIVVTDGYNLMVLRVGICPPWIPTFGTITWTHYVLEKDFPFPNQENDK